MWTGLATWAVWSITKPPIPPETPRWVVAAVACALVAVWWLVIRRLENPGAGLWSIAVLIGLFFLMAFAVAVFAPEGLPDWTVLPMLCAVGVLWVAILWRPLAVVDWIRALVWLSAITAVVNMLIHLIAVLCDITLGFFGGSTLDNEPGDAVSKVLDGSPYAVIACLLVSCVVWVVALRRQWSIWWALLVMFTVLPFLGPSILGAIYVGAVGPGVLIGWVILTIGLYKLAIMSVSRGSVFARSRIRRPEPGVRPRGMVE